MTRPINGQFRSLGVIVAFVLSVSAIAQTPGFARPKPPAPPLPRQKTPQFRLHQLIRER